MSASLAMGFIDGAILVLWGFIWWGLLSGGNRVFGDLRRFWLYLGICGGCCCCVMCFYEWVMFFVE